MLTKVYSFVATFYNRGFITFSCTLFAQKAQKLVISELSNTLHLVQKYVQKKSFTIARQKQFHEQLQAGQNHFWTLDIDFPGFSCTALRADNIVLSLPQQKQNALLSCLNFPTNIVIIMV